jgi:cysteine dioxygenase
VAKTFEQLVRYLDGLRGQADLGELEAELREVDVSCDQLARHINFSNRGYARNLVHAGAYHHLLVLCWKNGQRSPIHDHRGSVCAVRVLRGTMTETFFERAPNLHIKATLSRDIEPRTVVGGQDRDIHQVSNLQAADADLVTLHVYSPPLLTMGTYSLSDPTRGEEPMFVQYADAAGI